MVNIPFRSALTLAAALVVSSCSQASGEIDLVVAGSDVVFADTDFNGMLDDSTAPTGLDFTEYWVYADVDVLANETLAWFSSDAFTPSACAANPLFVELLSPEDVSTGATGSIHYWVEYGVDFAGVWTEAALVQARTFASAEAAAQFLVTGVERSASCVGGYTFTPSEGDIYRIDSVGVSREIAGYPPEVQVAEIDIDAGAEWGVGHFAFVQYGNVVAVVAVTDSQKIMQPPGRVHEIGINVARALVALSESVA